MTDHILKAIELEPMQELRDFLVDVLTETLTTMDPAAAAAAIADGELHRAVKVDWSLVLDAEPFDFL